jgi:ElaB/YqjD/DUF883 family membrane-anchored ribosome-binding protein
MPVDTLKKVADNTVDAAEDAADQGQRAFKDAMAQAERRLGDAAKTAERVLKEGVDALRAHTRSYTDNAGQHVDEAQRYVLERVKERPLTATLAGLGVGLLLGLLLSTSRNK